MGIYEHILHIFHNLCNLCGICYQILRQSFYVNTIRSKQTIDKSTNSFKIVKLACPLIITVFFKYSFVVALTF